MANPLDPIYVPMVRNSAKSTGTNSPSSYGNDMRSIANEIQDMLTAQAAKIPQVTRLASHARDSLPDVAGIMLLDVIVKYLLLFL